MTTDPAPTFLVGVPRSGTTLLAAMLAAHSRFDCGPETVFFSFWRGADRGRILGDPRWPSRAVAFLAALPAPRGSVPEAFGIGPEAIRAFLQRRPPRAGLLLEALTATHARVAGKPRWVEKSPIHLIHGPEIRRTFPDARIIRIVRDPRDVVLSLREVPWGERSLLANAYRWSSMDRASSAFFDDDPASLTVRFERLVTDPERELRRVCSFLGEAFEPAMLAPSRPIAGLSQDGEWWKARAGTALDPGRAFAWKRIGLGDDLAAVELICGDGLDRHGYERTARESATHAVCTLDPGTVLAGEGLLRRAAAAGVRFLPLRYDDVAVDRHPGDWPGPLVFLGDSIPGRTPAERRRDLGRLARCLIARRLAGRPSLRLAVACGASGRADLASRAARALLRLGCRTLDAGQGFGPAGEGFGRP